MQVDSATLNPALPATRVAEVTRAPVAPEPVAKADLEPNVVDISPIARARSALVRAGDAGNVDFAGPTMGQNSFQPEIAYAVLNDHRPNFTCMNPWFSVEAGVPTGASRA